jgi:N-succinyldiaminopimelate aminotransferase
VEENRRLYAEKFRAVLPLVKNPLQCALPDGGFYLWMRTPIDDAEFARRLHAQYNVLVLPGSFLARTVDGANPGAHHVRLALVPPLAECLEALERIGRFATSL